MPRYLLQADAFLRCEKEGKFVILSEVDIERIKSTFAIAESDCSTASFLIGHIPKDGNQWNGAYKLYYDALHELVEALLRFDGVKSENHQCLFVFLCEKHPELSLSWDFFETVRTKRNGINYYGTSVTYHDWKSVELQFLLYLATLRKEVEKKIGEWNVLHR